MERKGYGMSDTEKWNAEWKTMAVDAVYENTQKLSAFIENNLPKECSKRVCHQCLIVFDEIYSNVVKYSQAKQFELEFGILGDMVYLVCMDDGIPYNPLESEEPDVKAPKEKRKIGGLGLFFVKRIMDYLEYRYQDERNRFTIGKKF